MKTQKGEIEKYLLTHPEGLSSLEAYDLFGTTRLGMHIHLLRKEGMNIITEQKIIKNRYGGTSVYAVYKLGE